MNEHDLKHTETFEKPSHNKPSSRGVFDQVKSFLLAGKLPQTSFSSIATLGIKSIHFTTKVILNEALLDAVLSKTKKENQY